MSKATVKGKVFPTRDMKAQNGSRGTAPHILNLGTGWRCVVNFELRPLCTRERTQVATEEEATWGSEPVWAFWRREKIPHNSTRIMNHEYPEYFDARGPAEVSPQRRPCVQLQNGRCELINVTSFS